MRVVRDAQGRVRAAYKADKLRPAASAQVSNEEDGLKRLNEIVEGIAETHNRVEAIAHENDEERALDELRRLFPVDKEV